MKQTRLWLTTIAALLCSLTANAHDFEVGGIYYDITSSANLTVEVTYRGNYSDGYSNEYSGAVFIPSTATYNSKTYRVTSIGNSAFSGCSSLTSITIPESVTSIGNSAFYECTKLTSITIPESVTSIGSSAFEYCSSLTSITIPEGVTSIGNDAFYNCSSLTSITIPESVTSIGSKAFYNCSGELIVNCNIPSASSYENGAFYKSKFTKVTIGEGVTSIGSSAFYNCSSLTAITIPESVTSIGSSAFYGTAWYNNQPDGVVYVGKVLYDYKGTMPENTSIEVEEGTLSISPYAFYNCSSLTSITIPEGVTSIGYQTFYECSSLTSITLPESVTSIGESAFYKCSSLYKVINYSNLSLSKGSSSNGYVAYYAKVVYKGSDLTTVDDFQFYTSDGIHALVNYIGNDAEIVLPDSYNGENYKIEDCAFYNCSSLTSITIPESVMSIGDYAFFRCSSLTSITIPESVTSIGSSAFEYCSSLYSVTIGSGVLSIGSNAFSTPKKVIWLTNTPPTGYANAKGSINYVANNQHTNLSNVKVYPYLSSMFEVDGVKYVPVSPSERTCHAIDCAYDSTVAVVNVGETASFKGVAMKVTEVMPYAFYGNDHIKEVSVSHLGDIGYEAFYNCSGIESVEAANNGDIGRQAFYNCSGIESVEAANNGDIGEQAFYNCSGIKSVEAANNGDIGRQAFYNCSGIESVKAANNGDIGEQAFYNCDAIETVTISNQGSIGSQAFYDCNGIKSIDIRNQGTIGSQAFYGCNGMETAIVANYIPKAPSNNDAPLTFADWTSTNHSSSSTSSETYTFTAGEGATLSFSWSVSSEASYDKLIVTLDGTTILEKSGSLSGTYSNTISKGSHTLVVKYTKDRSNSSGSDQASVSNITVGKGGATTLAAGVGSEAFSGCSSLKTVTLGDSIGSLGDKAFYQCRSLQEIAIPDSVKSVGSYCFSGCSAMKGAVMGNGLTNIRAYTFENCTSLTDVTVGDGVTTISNYAFTGCSALINVALGRKVATINNYAFQNCSSLSEIILPQAVTKVGDYVFSGCSKLADVIIEDRTTALALGSNGSSALFADCPLDSVYIGGKITYSTTSSNGYSPFYRNTSLRTVVITDREEQMYNNEFYGCTNLKNVAIGNGVKSIGDYAFSGCSSLDGFSFGSSMESIGAEAFSDCTSLTSITSHAAVPPTCGTQALDDINKWGCTLRVPSGYASAYQGADQWKEFFFVEDVVEVAKYTLTFMVDGEVYRVDSLAHKAEMSMPEDPTKEGYTFSGWGEVPATMPAEDVTITGFFTINKYLVTFVIDDEVIASDSIEYNAEIIVPEALVKEGYTFSGWGEVPATMPAEDVTITGFFTINKYLVTFVIDDEVIASDSIEYNAEIIVPEAPVKEGYTFSGWSEVPATMPAEDVTITGFFTINKYLVTFVIDDEVIASDSIEYNAEIIVPEAPVKEGYTFSGWGEVPATMPAEDVKISGSFTPNIYKVYYYVDEELVHTAEVACDEVIPEYVYEPTVKGEVFVGWIGEAYETMPAHDITYKAEIEIRFITLTIDQYGSGTFCSIHDLDFSEVEGLKAYVATGYNTATGVVTLTRVMSAKSGEGLFLKGQPGDYEVPTLKSSESCMQNLLVGALDNTIVNSTSEDGLNANYEYKAKGEDTTPLFYRITDNITLEACKAYLQLPKAWIGTGATRAAIGLRFEDEEMEFGDEEQPADVAAPEVIYDLQGRRVANPTKGVFIVNGKKVVFK